MCIQPNILKKAPTRLQKSKQYNNYRTKGFVLFTGNFQEFRNEHGISKKSFSYPPGWKQIKDNNDSTINPDHNGCCRF